VRDAIATVLSARRRGEYQEGRPAWKIRVSAMYEEARPPATRGRESLCDCCSGRVADVAAAGQAMREGVTDQARRARAEGPEDALMHVPHCTPPRKDRILAP
jgi:hypothetical protein